MLNSVFLSVLQSSDNLPADLLRSAHVCAQETRSEELMCLLASRADLPKDVDESIGRETRAPIRAAWIARPGRTAAQVTQALAKEKRATVLAAVVATGNAPKEVLLELSKDSRPSVIAAVLQSNAPTEARANALKTLCGMYEDLPYATRHLIERTAQSGEVLPPEECVVFTSGNLLRSLVKASGRLSQEAYLHALEKLVVEPCQDASKQAGRSSYHRTWAIDRAFSDAIALLELVSDDACVEATRTALASQTSQKASQFAEALRLVENGLQTRASMLDEAAKQKTKTARLAALAAQASSHRDAELATVLVSNTALPREQFVSLLGVAPSDVLIRAACLRNDAALAATVITSGYFPDVSPIKEALEVYQEDLVHFLGGDIRVERLIADSESLHHLADAYVAATPLKDLVRWGFSTSNPVFSAAVCRQLAQLPPETFRFASALQNGWEGTLTDLIAACQAVCE